MRKIKLGGMDKKGISESNVIDIILLVLFLTGMMVFVSKQQDGVKVWESYYSSEIAKIVNMASPGEEIILDVQKATEIAKAHKVSQSQIFSFDNVKNEVRIKLSSSGATGFRFYNDVEIADVELIQGYDDGINKLSFKIREVSKNA